MPYYAACRNFSPCMTLPVLLQIISQANKSLDSLHRITGYTLWNEPELPKATTLKIKKFAVKEELKKSPEGEMNRHQ